MMIDRVFRSISSGIAPYPQEKLVELMETGKLDPKTLLPIGIDIFHGMGEIFYLVAFLLDQRILSFFLLFLLLSVSSSSRRRRVKMLTVLRVLVW